MATVITSLSLAFQIAAALMALRLVRITGRRAAWSLIAAALVLMALRRAIPLYRLINNDPLAALDPVNETIGLALSFLMVMGVAKMAPLFTSFKLSEAMRMKSEERFKNTLDHMLEGCQIIGYDWRYLYINDVAGKHNHKPKEELLGKRYMDVWPGIETTSVFGFIQRCMEDRMPHHMENEFIFPDGTSGWFDLNIQPVPEGVFILSIDVTERKMVDETLKVSEDKFRGIFEDSTVGKSLTAPDGKLLQINRTFADMLGYTIEELQQVNFAEITHPEDIAESRECIRCLLANERESYRMEKRYFSKGGSIVWANVSARLHRNVNGKPEYLITSIVNITDRKRAEELLRASEVRYRRLFETAKDGIIILDAETGLIVDVNPFLIKLLGITYELFMGKAIWDIGFFKDILLNKDKFLELQEKEYVRYEDLPLETADGRTIDVEFVSNVYEIDRKKVIQCNIRDITERKRAEEERRHFTEELARSNVDLQQFAYVASHDLQEPLRMISSYLQLIEKRYKDRLDADANDFINFAVDGANHLQSLIGGLLEFSRIKTQGKSFNRVNVKEVLDSLCRDLELQITEAGAVIDYGEMPAITADETQIFRLFQNLVQNAIKFRREGAALHIRISAEKRGNEFVFCVNDNGIGIEEQYFERIFIIFQRLHGREEYPGTGIGLAICKRIVERHGGRIWVESRPGEGSSFYFSIPAIDVKNNIATETQRMRTKLD